MRLAQCSDTMGTATRTTSRLQVAVFLYQYYVHRLDYRRPHFRCANAKCRKSSMNSARHVGF